MRLFLLALTTLYALSAAAQTGSAIARGYCRSLCLYPTTTVNRIGNASYNLLFTSYDAAHNLPLFVPATGTNEIIVSSELRSHPGSSTYSTTFSLWQNGFVVRDGLLKMSLPTIDADRNRIRDLMQPELTFYAGAKGRARDIWPSTNVLKFEARLSRAGEESIGSYSGFMTGTAASFMFTGELGLLHLSGTADYARGSTNRMTLTLVRSGKLGEETTLVGSTTYKAISNVVIIAKTTLEDDFGRIYVMKSSTLYRRGNRYLGTAIFLDGDPETPWADYKEWTLELVDETDSDANRVPDLSDPSAVPDDRGPVVTITAPLRTVRVSTFPFTIRGTAKDKSGVQYVEYRIQNGEDTVAFGEAIGTTRWSIQLESLLRGTNTVWVRASDTLGNLSGEVRRKLIYRGE